MPLKSKKYAGTVRGNEVVARGVEGRTTVQLVAKPEALKVLGKEYVEEILEYFDPRDDVRVYEGGELELGISVFRNNYKHNDLFELVASNYDLEYDGGDVNTVSSKFKTHLEDIEQVK
jgi:hypothetical protein